MDEPGKRAKPPSQQARTAETSRSLPADPSLARFAVGANPSPSLKLSVSFHNLSTNTKIMNGKKYYGKERFDILKGAENTVVIDELTEGGLVLLVPSKSGAAGHQVQVTVKAETESAEKSVTIACKVESVEVFAGGLDRFVLRISQADSEGWNEVLSLLDSRQKEIEDFLLLSKE